MPQKMKYILTGSASNFEKRKGIPLFLQSIVSLLDSQPQLQKEICVLVVGGSIEKEKIDSRVQWRFLGNIVSEESLSMLYCASDVFALPSIEDNLPNMMVESLSCGTPVVGFNVGGVTENVVDGLTGFLAEPGDTRGFSGAIRRVLTSSEAESDAMKRNCRDFAELRFSSLNTTEKYAALYRRLAAKKSGESGSLASSSSVDSEYEDLIANYYRRVIEGRDKTIQRMATTLDYKIGGAIAWPIRKFKNVLHRKD